MGKRVVISPVEAVAAITCNCLVGVGLACALTGVNRDRLKRWVQRGTVTEYRLMGGVLVDVVEVNDTLRRIEGGPILGSDVEVRKNVLCS